MLAAFVFPLHRAYFNRLPVMVPRPVIESLTRNFHHGIRPPPVTPTTSPER
jgi:hypothetical protein